MANSENQGNQNFSLMTTVLAALYAGVLLYFCFVTINGLLEFFQWSALLFMAGVAMLYFVNWELRRLPPLASRIRCLVQYVLVSALCTLLLYFCFTYRSDIPDSTRFERPIERPRGAKRFHQTENVSGSHINRERDLGIRFLGFICIFLWLGYSARCLSLLLRSAPTPRARPLPPLS